MDVTNEANVKVAHQTRSPFFRLPQEIRLQIYEHAIGFRYFHIRRMKEKNNRKKSIRPRRYTCGEHGENHIIEPGWTNCYVRHGRPSNSHTLALLRSCRFM